MIPALNPTLRAMSSVSPRVFTSAAVAADWRGSSPLTSRFAGVAFKRCVERLKGATDQQGYGLSKVISGCVEEAPFR